MTEAYRAVSTDARRAIGLVAGSTEVGSPADLFAIRARSLHEALADASEARVVFKHGSLVAATSVTTTWTGPVDTASSSLRSAEAQA